ncbi:hypothetical protein [Pectobacterium carotovorum]|uniref:hypothetical protein n=1 Tax=Pectobacterium carotovorum TaxID=554 RepID=UPI00381E1D7F
MKRHKIRKQLKKLEAELGFIETNPNVVGYALFNTEKKAFIELIHSQFGSTDVYTGDLEAAYIASTQIEALNMFKQLEDGRYIKIVPLVQNELFGLTPDPDYSLE